MYKWWDSSIVLRGTAKEPISFDTETEMINGPLHIPKVALGMCHVKESSYLIHPTDFNNFFYKHRNEHFVGHNIQFDFWVVHETLGKPYKQLLWDLGDKGNLHDTMILDQLLQLASGKFRNSKGGYDVGKDTKVFPTNLGQLAKEAGSLKLDKDDPYRLRFSELLGLTKQQMQEHPEWEGFVKYAIPDVIATYDVYKHLYQKAVAAMIKAGYNKNKTAYYEIHPTALDKYGPLSEAIQVRGSIALAHLSRQPLPINLAERQAYEDEVRATLQNQLDYLEKVDPAFYQRYGAKAKKYVPNSVKTSKRTGLPCFNDKVLKRVLSEEAIKIGVPVKISKGKTGAISTSAKDWAQYKDKSEFIKNWVELETNAKTLQFLVELNYPAVYSNYDLLKKTGRTGASAHRGKKGLKEIPSVNIQQMPRNARIRKLFAADSDKLMASIDYGYIELRTLAACNIARFGKSHQGEAIKKHYHEGGLDPHETMACVVMQVSADTYRSLDKAQRVEARQSAKISNFSLPGGLGAQKFVDYAKASYDKVYTLEEAKNLKEIWLKTFPEMKQHLGDTTEVAMAYNLDVSVDTIRATFPRTSKWQDTLRDVKQALYDGKRMTDELHAALYGLLLNTKKNLVDLLKDVKEWRKLHDELFLYRACTLTGRVRGRVGYCDGCNCPFQGLASDGGKEALWRLLYLKYDIRAFIHDAFIAMVKDEEETKKIVKIMCDEMEKVIGHGIPVACDYTLGEHWVK